MRVPKCKECEFMYETILADYSNYKERRCQYIENRKHENGVTENIKWDIWIKSSEFKTSPKWCPKRDINTK